MQWSVTPPHLLLSPASLVQVAEIAPVKNNQHSLSGVLVWVDHRQQLLSSWNDQEHWRRRSRKRKDVEVSIYMYMHKCVCVSLPHAIVSLKVTIILQHTRQYTKHRYCWFLLIIFQSKQPFHQQLYTTHLKDSTQAIMYREPVHLLLHVLCTSNMLQVHWSHLVTCL